MYAATYKNALAGANRRSQLKVQYWPNEPERDGMGNGWYPLLQSNFNENEDRGVLTAELSGKFYGADPVFR